MLRGQSTDIRFRKKPSFKPIMLTSKSMRPVQRGSPEKNRPEPKPNKNIDQEQFKRKNAANCMIYANTMAKAEFIKKMTQSVCGQNTETHASKNRKIAASIVKMQLWPQQEGAKHHNRYQPQYNYSIFAQNRKNSKKFYYYTQHRNQNYDQNKMKERLKPTTANSFSAEMNLQQICIKKKQASKIYQCENFLKRNNLSIKKTKSLSNRPEMIISKEKLEEISARVSEYQTNLLKKLEENYNSPRKDVNSPEKQKSLSVTKKLKVNVEKKSDITRIQEDICLKRNNNKKEHFIFGMGDTNKNAAQSMHKARFEIYKDFIWKIAYSNGLFVHLKDQIQHPYKVYIGPGNNSLLIKGILRRRYWWQIVDKPTKQTNFVWTQLKLNEYFSYQQRHVFHTHHQKTMIMLRTRKIHSSMDSEHKAKKQIETEQNSQSSVVLNEVSSAIELKNYHHEESESTVEPDSNSKIFAGRDFKIWQRHYQMNKRFEDKMQNTLNRRIKTMIRKKNMKYIEDSMVMRAQNHFQCNYFLGNKKALFYSLKKYYTLVEKNPFDYIPLTFHIVDGINDPEFQKFMEYYEQFNEDKKNKKMQNIWIVKPGEHTNRGRGITVCSVLDEIKIRLKSKEKSKKNNPHTYIVQKYIQRPLLYQKRKFDIRHYMLMTCVNGSFKGYWYSEGYLRTTSFQYNTKNCRDLYTHLTNDAIQKYSADYGKFEKGNKVSYSDFQKYLKATYGSKSSKHDFVNKILPKMKELATDAMKATYMLLSPNRYSNSFELFGLDYMLDEDMNLYLIEVNTNPCLQISCPLLSKMISGLIQNVYKICLDPYFPPPFEWSSQKKMQIGQNALQQNKFSLVFDENEEGEKLERLYASVSKVDQKMGEIDEQEQQFEDEGKEWDQD